MPFAVHQPFQKEVEEALQKGYKGHVCRNLQTFEGQKQGTEAISGIPDACSSQFSAIPDFSRTAFSGCFTGTCGTTGISVTSDLR